ncbi:hypothetical protein FOCC_FOCC005749 [Frankliniella occidentalis]|nr:hypothetical protein FOCC_FOCC005749 [Frankliniella occidentalis]
MGSAAGLGGTSTEDPWSEPVAASNPFSPAAHHYSFGEDFGYRDPGPHDISDVFGVVASEGEGVSPAFGSPAAGRSARTTPGTPQQSGSASTPRSQVRLLIGTPSREAVVVPGESSPRNLRSAVSSRPASPTEPSQPAAAMRRSQAPSWDTSYAGSSFGFDPGRRPQHPHPQSFQSSSTASSGGWPPSWPQQAARAAPVAAIALPFPAGPFGGGAWGGHGGFLDGQSYDGTYDSYGYQSMGRRGQSPGPWQDSLGQTYGSTEASEQTGASSLGGGGWPYRYSQYSLSRSRSAPSTISEGERERLQPTRLENRFGTGTGAVISAMVYPDATVASATYQTFVKIAKIYRQKLQGEQRM